MKVFLVERPVTEWLQDYAMVIVVKDILHAEKKARMSLDDFKKIKKLQLQKLT